MAERELAVVSFQNGYAGLIEAMRNRAAARRIAISSENFAQLCGLPSYYAVKLLSVNPVRRIGALSLGPMLGALGLKLIVAEDEEAVARFTSRLPVRNESCVHTGTMEWRISRRAFRQIQAKGRRSRWDNMTPKQRSAWARKLNRIRWAKARGGEAKG
ncbi:MAG: hypothetical protein WAM72_03470 [Xanthobacteraceae bacterium]